MAREEKIGPHVLHLGDCREILPTLGKVDAIVTDPPYGIGFTKKSSGYNGKEVHQASHVYSDDPKEIRAMLAVAIPGALSIAERALIFSGPAAIWSYPEPAAIGSVYTPAGAGRCAWGFQGTHPILFYGKDPFLQDGSGGRPNSFRDEQPNTEARHIDHPTPKPLKWMLWAVGRATRCNEKVLDPFMGSGTTGVACAKMGRRFIGIEIDEKYFDIACQRVEAAMNQPDLFIRQPTVKAEQLSLLGDVAP